MGENIQKWLEANNNEQILQDELSALELSLKFSIEVTKDYFKDVINDLESIKLADFFESTDLMLNFFNLQLEILQTEEAFKSALSQIKFAVNQLLEQKNNDIVLDLMSLMSQKLQDIADISKEIAEKILTSIDQMRISFKKELSEFGGFMMIKPSNNLAC